MASGTVIRAVNKPSVSLLVLFSKEFVYDRFIEQLRGLQMPYQKTEIVILLDSNNKQLFMRLCADIEAITKDKGYNGSRVYFSEKSPLGNFDPVHMRRLRIAQNHEEAKTFLSDTDWLFLYEDDTFFRPDAFNLLKSLFNRKTGFVEGAEVGRWELRHIGAWSISPVGNPTKIKTVLPKKKGTTVIQGGGFYCLVTKTKLYKAARFRSEAECLGVDVVYGWDLAKEGYVNRVFWWLPCEHVTETKSIFVDGEIISLEWQKIGDKWELQPITKTVTLNA